MANNPIYQATKTYVDARRAPDVHARPDDWTPSASDVHARPDTWTPEAVEISAIYDGASTDVQAALNSLKNSVSDGKTLVAAAITAKGVATTADDSFATMATNIELIRDQLLLEDLTVVPNDQQQVFTSPGINQTTDEYYGFNQVTVEPVPTEHLIANQSGTYLPTAGKYFNGATITLPTTALQDKTVIPTESTQTITADSSYGGLARVTVNAIQASNRTITTNGSYSPDAGKYFKTITVNVQDNFGISTHPLSVTAKVGDIVKFSVGASGPDLVYQWQYRPSGSTTWSNSTNPGYNTPTVETTATMARNGISYRCIVHNTTNSVTTQTATLTVYDTIDATTVIPDSTIQTIVAPNILATGNIKVAAVPTETKNITTNGTHTPTTGKYFDSVTVNVPNNFTTQSKTVTPTAQSQQVTPDAGYSGLSAVNINAIPTNFVGSSVTKLGATTYTPSNIAQKISKETYLTGDITIAAVPTETKTISTNGTYTPTSGNYFSSVTVNVPTQTARLQTKTVTPSASSQTLSPDSGYDGLSSVTINPIDSKFIGSDVTRQTSSSVATSGATVTIPAGYYSSQVTKSVAGATQATPSLSINSMTGVVTATSTQSAGYVAAGTKSNTLSLVTANGITITPSTRETIAVGAGTYVLGDIKVAAIQTESLTASASGTYTPSAGKYFNSVTVNIPSAPVLQSRTVSPTSISQTIRPQTGYDGLSSVTVNAVPVETKTIVSNGTYTPTNGKFFSSVTVDIPTSGGAPADPILQTKTITPLTTQQTISPDSGYDGLSSVIVNAIQTETKTINANGTYTPTTGKYFSSVSVNIPSNAPTLQTKSVSPSNSQQTITPDAGYDALSSVTIARIPADYIGSGITTRTSSSLTASGATVTVPAGYYASQVTKSIAAGSVTVGTPTISNSGLVTASATVSAGYVSGNPTNKTLQLTTQAAKSVTPTKSSQTAVASGVYTTGAITVNPIPAEYVVPTGSERKTENGTYNVSNLAELIVNVLGGDYGARSVNNGDGTQTLEITDVTNGGSNPLPTGITAMDYGSFTISSAFTTTAQTFNHNLGVTPDFMIVYAPNNIATTYSMLGATRGSLFNWRSGYDMNYFYHANSTTTVSWANVNSNYGISAMTSTTFNLASPSTQYYWRAGDYKYIAIKF